MAMTIRRLIASPSLGLSLAAGRAGIDRVITWAHAIELVDPSPWLSGGELVMTTGLQLPDNDAGQREYVMRIAESGSAAVAFDTGRRFLEVPTAMCTAADEVGIPVLAVASTTPFVDISHAVIDEVGRGRIQSMRQIVQGQESLARAMVTGSIPGLVKALSAAANCSACVVDRSGHVLAESMADRLDLVSRVRTQMREDHVSSRAFVDDSGSLTIQQLRGPGEGQGYLAVASATAMGPAERTLVAHAVSLLSIELAKRAGVVAAEQRLRTGVAHALFYNSLDIDTSLLDYFGFAGDATITVAAFTALGPLPQAQQELTAALGQTSTPYLMSTLPSGDGIAFAIHADVANDVIDRVYRRLRAGLRRSINGGIGRPAIIGNVKLSLQQALSAVRVAAASGEKLVAFEELGTFSLLLSTQSDDVLHAIAASWLTAIEDHDRERGTRLLQSLESFLHHNGHWDAAASELGVHRHTLRKRIERVAQLIGRDIDSAHTRSELWIALKAKELLLPISGQDQRSIAGLAG